MKLDELYSDTNAGGFLDSAATPGPTPWHQQRAEVTAAERVRFVETSVSIPSTMILPPGVTTTMNLSGLALAGLARAATDNETDRVYNNSVDDARKDLGDDRAQDSLDDALADFDQAITLSPSIRTSQDSFFITLPFRRKENFRKNSATLIDTRDETMHTRYHSPAAQRLP